MVSAAGGLGLLLLAACVENPFLPDRTRPTLKASWRFSGGYELELSVDWSDPDVYGLTGMHSYGNEVRWRFFEEGKALFFLQQWPEFHDRLPDVPPFTVRWRIPWFRLHSERPGPENPDGMAPVVTSVALEGTPRRDLIRVVFTATDTGPAGLMIRDDFRFWAMDRSGNISRPAVLRLEGCRVTATWTPVMPGPMVGCEFAVSRGADRFELVFDPSSLGPPANPHWGQPWRLSQLYVYDRSGNVEMLSESGPYYYSSVRGPTSLPIVEVVVP